MKMKISSFPNLDKMMERLHSNKKNWVMLPLPKKLQYLEKIRNVNPNSYCFFFLLKQIKRLCI